jgi:hypothetical protein
MIDKSERRQISQKVLAAHLYKLIGKQGIYI